jgi:hypothetical protein
VFWVSWEFRVKSDFFGINTGNDTELIIADLRKKVKPVFSIFSWLYQSPFCVALRERVRRDRRVS